MVKMTEVLQHAVVDWLVALMVQMPVEVQKVAETKGDPRVMVVLRKHFGS